MAEVTNIGNTPPILKENIIDAMSQIPGIDRDNVISCVKERRFDPTSAIYDLINDKLEDNVSITIELSPISAHSWFNINNNQVLEKVTGVFFSFYSFN